MTSNVHRKTRSLLFLRQIYALYYFFVYPYTRERNNRFLVFIRLSFNFLLPLLYYFNFPLLY